MEGETAMIVLQNADMVTLGAEATTVALLDLVTETLMGEVIAMTALRSAATATPEDEATTGAALDLVTETRMTGLRNVVTEILEAAAMIAAAPAPAMEETREVALMTD